MRVLRIIPSLNPKGGGPIEGARKIDREIRSYGHDIEVVCLDVEDSGDYLKDYPGIVHTLGPSSGRYGYNSRLIPWLKLNRHRFDVAIVNGLWQYHGYATWKVFANSDTPYFVFTHGMLDPWFKVRYPLKHLKKWMYWPWADYRLLRDAKGVLFTSEEERLLAKKSFWLYKCNEIVTTYGTASPPSNTNYLSEIFLQRFPELQGKRIVLFLSRIHEKKGCDLLISAFAQLALTEPDLHLVMAGPDEAGWKSHLEEQATRSGIANRITWTGMLQGDEKWGAFYSAEVFCLPSHQENFGIVVAEALACGKPVLISNKVNIWREIEADKAGFIQNDTLDGTSKMLGQWLALSPESKLQMQKAARQCFDARFRIDRVANSLVNILQMHVTTGY